MKNSSQRCLNDSFRSYDDHKSTKSKIQIALIKCEEIISLSHKYSIKEAMTSITNIDHSNEAPNTRSQSNTRAREVSQD